MSLEILQNSSLTCQQVAIGFIGRDGPIVLPWGAQEPFHPVFKRDYNCPIQTFSQRCLGLIAVTALSSECQITKSGKVEMRIFKEVWSQKTWRHVW